MKRANYLVLFLLLATSGCYLPSRSTDHSSISMENPSLSTYISEAGLPVDLKAAGGIQGGGATAIAFYVFGPSGGGMIGTIPVDPGTFRPSAETLWTPAATGEYWVQAELRTSTNSNAISPAVRICIVDVGDQPDGAVQGNGYEGPCSIPTAPAVLIASSQSVSMHAASNPNQLCLNETLPIIFEFSATADDPSGRVAFVRLHISSSTFEDYAILNQSNGGTSGTRMYRAEIGLESGGAGTFNWEAWALDRSGNILAQENHTIPLVACNTQIAPLTLATPAPASTPASARDCPSGTYYSDTKHLCINIQIQPTRPTRPAVPAGGACQPPPKGCFPFSWIPAQCKCGVP